jgi:hypothetical protein
VLRLALPYFRSEDRLAGRGLLGAILAIELGQVGIAVLLNSWNARFYDALQHKNASAFGYELIVFVALAASFILLAVYQLYLSQGLRIRWRQDDPSLSPFVVARFTSYRIRFLLTVRQSRPAHFRGRQAIRVEHTVTRNWAARLLGYDSLIHRHPVGSL